MTPQPPVGFEQDQRTYRFDIRRGPLGFWWWTWTGHGIANIQGGGGHLPRRSREACVEAAEAFAQRQTEKSRRHHHEYRYEVPA